MTYDPQKLLTTLLYSPQCVVLCESLPKQMCMYKELLVCFIFNILRKDPLKRQLTDGPCLYKVRLVTGLALGRSRISIIIMSGYHIL